MDEQAERQIQTLINPPAIFCSLNQILGRVGAFVAMSYNEATQTAMQETPNFLLYGRDMNLRGKLMILG